MSIKAHILVVDDEPGMRSMMRFELESRGYQVVTAANGSEALVHLKRSEFDLVITDVRMPEKDGLAVLRSAKEATPDIEVIIVTGFADLESAIECLRAGACDLIQKPFHLEEFLSSVDRAIKHSRLRITASLYEACQAMLAGNGEIPLCELIAETAMRLLRADDVSVMLLDSSDRLRIVYATGIPEAVQAETRLALGERVAGRVALDRSPAVLPEALTNDSRFEGIQGHGRVRSGIIYPLVHGNSVLGVINLNRIHLPRRFRRADLQMAGIVAAQASIALRNERLAQNLVASERLAALGLFAAGIVHEINNPLTYIKGNVAYVQDTLQSLPTDAHGGYHVSRTAAQEVKMALADVEKGVRMLQNIVEDMRKLCRREQELDERLDVNDSIHSALRIAGPLLRHVVDTSAELGKELIVVGSSGQLSQVLLNLLVNAAQALESMARTDGRIIIRSRREDAQVLVEVTDNGPGIPPMHLRRVMEPFYTTKPKDKGSGLGLSISREIVENHGGALRVQSHVGVGTTFTVSLPAAPAEGRDAFASSRPSPAEVEARRARILIVDDEPTIRRVLGRLFGHHYDVCLAEDGAEALKIIQKDQELDAIVSDIAMPRITGIELYRQLRKRWPGLAARTIFVTGAVLEAHDQKFLLEAGGRILWKPLDFTELRAAVDHIVALFSRESPPGEPNREDPPSPLEPADHSPN